VKNQLLKSDTHSCEDFRKSPAQLGEVERSSHVSGQATEVGVFAESKRRAAAAPPDACFVRTS